MQETWCPGQVPDRYHRSGSGWSRTNYVVPRGIPSRYAIRGSNPSTRLERATTSPEVRNGA